VSPFADARGYGPDDDSGESKKRTFMFEVQWHLCSYHKLAASMTSLKGWLQKALVPVQLGPHSGSISVQSPAGGHVGGGAGSVCNESCFLCNWDRTEVASLLATAPHMMKKA
jgi:hypothetical protein